METTGKKGYKARIIDLGSAPPDDPMFSEPVRVFFPLELRPSTRNTQKSADGTSPAEQADLEGVEQEGQSEEVPDWSLILVRL